MDVLINWWPATLFFPMKFRDTKWKRHFFLFDKLLQSALCSQTKLTSLTFYWVRSRICFHPSYSLPSFSSRCPLLKTSFSSSHSLLHTVPLVCGWLVNVSGFTVMAEGSKGSGILPDIPFGEWRSQGWYYSTNGSAALPLPCFPPAVRWLCCLAAEVKCTGKQANK